MILNQIMNVMEKVAQELKETEPEKRNHFIKSTMMLLDVSTEMLKTNPEFRKKFAEVHSIFLEYPESKETLDQGIKAYKEFIKGDPK